MSENNELNWIENIITRREEGFSNNRIFGEFSKVWVSGIIEKDFEYSHSAFEKNFYKTRIEVNRLSGIKDLVPIVVCEELISDILNKSSKGRFAEVGGEFRSYNSRGTDGKSHLHVHVFAKIINVCENDEGLEEAVDTNLIYLNGHICKTPLLRTTPLGRKITDIIIAVKRGTQVDYIPCIAWGSVALQISELETGDNVELYGRVQSRQYLKRFSLNSEDGEIKETYEISIMNLM